MKKIVFLFLFFSLVSIQGCSLPFHQDESVNTVKTERTIQVLDLHRTTLDALPHYDPFKENAFQVDLRSYDLTGMSLNKSMPDLLFADFDTQTKWPYWLPEGYDPKKILAYGKNPGLNIHILHEEGITGKNIGIAIIDDVLLPNHVEYQHTIKSYEEISSFTKEASVTGGQLASVAVGKTVGIAPDADLYYFAETHLSEPITLQAGMESYAYQALLYEPLVASINRVLDINSELGDGQKIKVVCIGQEIPYSDKGYYIVEEAINRAQDQGIFVLSSLLYETSNYTMDFNGLGRDPLTDPDDLSSYSPALNYSHSFYTFGRYIKAKEGLLVPTDSKCTAAPTGSKDYAFYRQGCESIGLAYLAGLYALACQVDPDITPEVFWDAALKTGDALTLIKNNTPFTLKKIVNPVRLIKEITP